MSEIRNTQYLLLKLVCKHNARTLTVISFSARFATEADIRFNLFFHSFKSLSESLQDFIK